MGCKWSFKLLTKTHPGLVCRALRSNHVPPIYTIAVYWMTLCILWYYILLPFHDLYLNYIQIYSRFGSSVESIECCTQRIRQLCAIFSCTIVYWALQYWAKEWYQRWISLDVLGILLVWCLRTRQFYSNPLHTPRTVLVRMCSACSIVLDHAVVTECRNPTHHNFRDSNTRIYRFADWTLLDV